MLEINYTMTAQETADATLDFLTNRATMAFMFAIMKYSCLMLCFVFAITAYNKAAQPQDIATVIFALIWIVFYKKINRWIVKSALRHRRFTEMHPKIKIDHKRMQCTGQATNPINIEWKSLRNILKTKNGYIVPLTGLRNAGRFIWLPFRGFNTPACEQEFVDLAQNFRIKIKKVT